MRVLWARAFLIVPTLMVPATVASRAQSEPPKAFLHCIGETTDHKATEHTITIYSKTAMMDFNKYDFSDDDEQYALQADRPPLDMSASHWIVIMAINRITGSYEISDGPTLVQQVKTEEGTCTKMDRKL